MVPVIIPVLFLNHEPNSICCVPLDILLNILSIIVMMLLVPIFMLNVIDINVHFKEAYIFFFLFIFGSIAFVLIGYIGMKRKSVQLMNVAVWICVLTYLEYLIVCFYSVWSLETLRQTSINRRCALTLWLFDWCERSTHWAVTNVAQFNSIMINDDQPSTRVPFNFYPTVRSMALHTLNTSVDEPESSYSLITSQNVHDSLERSKRSLVDLATSGRQPSGPEYKKAVGYTLAVFFIITFVSTLYTTFGYLLCSIKTMLIRITSVHFTFDE